MNNINTFEYKGYKGSISVDIESQVIHGKILFIRDLITYEADTIPNLEKAFIEAVDEYLVDCTELGVEPNKPFSGTLQIRINPERHKKVAVAAFMSDTSANAWIVRAIDHELEGRDQVIHKHETHNHFHRAAFKFPVEAPKEVTLATEVPSSTGKRPKFKFRVTH